MEDFIRCLQDRSKEKCKFDYRRHRMVSPERMVRESVYDFSDQPGILECQSKSTVNINGIHEYIMCTYTKNFQENEKDDVYILE